MLQMFLLIGKLNELSKRALKFINKFLCFSSQFYPVWLGRLLLLLNFWRQTLHSCIMSGAGKTVGIKWTSFFNGASIIRASITLKIVSDSFPKNLRNMRSDSSVLLTEFGSGLVVGNIPLCCMSFPWRDLSIRSFRWYEMSFSSQAGRLANRLFYLSIPPDIFVDVARCASHSATSLRGWTRVIVEKPFGRDSQSSAELTRGLKQHLKEEQIYRWGILDEFTLNFHVYNHDICQ